MSATEYYLQGRQGGIVLTSTSTTAEGAGPFRWIQVVNDTVLDSILGNTGLENDAGVSIVNAENLESLTLPAGLGIGGSFTEVALTSGAVIAYYA